jgi:hypothetical protein
VILGSRTSFIQSLESIHLFPQRGSFGGHNTFHVSDVNGCPSNHVEVLSRALGYALKASKKVKRISSVALHEICALASPIKRTGDIEV